MNSLSFETLTSLSDELKVFIDHAGLEGGDDYEAKIAQSIGELQWFVIICSGPRKTAKDINWCFYEAGQFRAKLQAAGQDKTVRDRDTGRTSAGRKQLARYRR
jgi:hypothetical protein